MGHRFTDLFFVFKLGTSERNMARSCSKFLWIVKTKSSFNLKSKKMFGYITDDILNDQNQNIKERTRKARVSHRIKSPR